MDQKEWDQAGKYVNELIKVNRRDEELLELQKEIDNALVPILREALDKGEPHGELSGKELRSFWGGVCLISSGMRIFLTCLRRTANWKRRRTVSS